MKLFLSLFLFLLQILQLSGLTFKVAVVGASGNLGRELVYQSITDHNWNVLGLTSKPNIFYEPVRINSFNIPNNLELKEFNSNKLILSNYWEYICDDYENIIFCTNGKPFQKDYSYLLTQKILTDLSPKCKSISLISAFGVKKNLKSYNLGIQIMNNLYLKDVYKNKRDQEALINSYNNDIKTLIYRPKALSFGKTIINSTSRKELAKIILDNIK